MASIPLSQRRGHGIDLAFPGDGGSFLRGRYMIRVAITIVASPRAPWNSRLRSKPTLFDRLMGHGWRQVEVRRIRAGDVRDVQDSMLWVRGKERDEWPPILPESLERLQELGQGQRRMACPSWSTVCTPELGSGVTGHDLRRTFATQVRLACGDEFLAVRLLRDKIPGVNDRYLVFPPAELLDALSQYSPLRRAKWWRRGREPVSEVCGRWKGRR